MSLFKTCVKCLGYFFVSFGDEINCLAEFMLAMQKSCERGFSIDRCLLAKKKENCNVEKTHELMLYILGGHDTYICEVGRYSVRDKAGKPRRDMSYKVELDLDIIYLENLAMIEGWFVECGF